MFKTIEIIIGKKKLIIDECDYRKYKDVIKTIKGFINECLDELKEKGDLGATGVQGDTGQDW